MHTLYAHIHYYTLIYFSHIHTMYVCTYTNAHIRIYVLLLFPLTPEEETAMPCAMGGGWSLWSVTGRGRSLPRETGVRGTFPDLQRYNVPPTAGPPRAGALMSRRGLPGKPSPVCPPSKLPGIAPAVDARLYLSRCVIPLLSSSPPLRGIIQSMRLSPTQVSI